VGEAMVLKPRAKPQVKLQIKPMRWWHGHYWRSICLVGGIDHFYGSPKVGGEGENIKFHKCAYIFGIRSFFMILLWSRICWFHGCPHDVYILGGETSCYVLWSMWSGLINSCNYTI
jgi:hypothetical protein